MTKEELAEILTKKPEEAVEDLQQSSFTVPLWENLEPQYDPLQHEIITNLTAYPAKLNDNGADDFKRTALALQKLAVRRISQALFATPVSRKWNFDKTSERQIKAVDIIEEIYRVQNYIDSENMERGKQNNAACEIVTVWSSYETKEPFLVEGESAKRKLTHFTYSPINGYTIYAINDPNGELLVVSIFYKDADDTEFLDVYTNSDAIQFFRFKNDEGWALDAEVPNGNPQTLEVFPVVHTWLSEPVWGGLAGTGLVEQLEEIESYDGLYIKRNSNPKFTVYYGEGTLRKETEEDVNSMRDLIEVAKGGEVHDITWKGAGVAVKDRVDRLRNAFFETNQIPDNSFATLINSNTSAENKELVFSDVKARALDLGGEWTRMFYDEINIVLKFAKIMFPSFKTEFESISARSVIHPYNIKSTKDSAEIVALASSSMSLDTQVREIGLVDDVGQEVEAIEGDRIGSMKRPSDEGA